MEVLLDLLKDVIQNKGKNPRITVKNMDDFKKKNSINEDSITYEGVLFPLSESPDQKEEFVIHYN